MAKWVDARDLKSLSVKPSAGSNPAPSILRRANDSHTAPPSAQTFFLVDASNP